MTVEIIENFDGIQAVSEIGAMYPSRGDGLIDEFEVYIQKAAGPNTLAGQAQSPRNPPSTLTFNGRSYRDQNVVEIDMYDHSKSFGTTASEDKIIAFNFKPMSGENLGQTSWDSSAAFLNIYVTGSATIPNCSIRVGHSLEFYDAPENEYEGGGINLQVWDGDSTSTVNRLWGSLNNGLPELAAEAGLYYANGPNNYGIFLEYGKWAYIELLYTTGGTSELRINGVTMYRKEGVPWDYLGNVSKITLRSGAETASSFLGSGFGYEITDFSVSDASVTENWVYPAVIDTMKITTEVLGDFTPETGTDNAVMVDEVPHDYDTTYNESNTAAHKDRFSTTQQVPYTAINGDVYAVKVQAVMKDTLDTGTRTARVVIFENATEDQGPTVTLTESGFQSVWGVFPENPDTVAAWEKAEVNGSEAGYEIVS